MAGPKGARVTPTLLWLRKDLRLSDHPALLEAVGRGPVIPVYILDPEGEGDWAPGGASRWWLHQSLESLDTQLRKLESRLIVRRGPSLRALLDLVKETGAGAVFWSRCYEPAIEARDKAIRSAMERAGVETRVFASALLFEPEAVRTRTDGPYQVFTPFWRACQAAPKPAAPLPAPRKIPAPEDWPASLEPAGLELLPRIDWAVGLRETWRPGAEGARALLKARVTDVLPEYAETRDDPNAEGTSRLSPHLHFGEVGIREVWAEVEKRAASPGLDAQAKASLLAFQRQLIWREFAHHLLAHFPHIPDQPLRPSFRNFPWRKDGRALKAWQLGRTGYPYVDAGLRQLWATGWMHNRVRMAAASFLVKDLLIPWQEGARWFWDTLVDADLAQNTLGWQWVAGCGADAAPYFRIFHPVTQGERFDPHGDYVRRWVPELARLEGKWIHRPWEAPEETLQRAGVVLGKTYPKRLVDHAMARERALAAYHGLEKQSPKKNSPHK